MSRIRTLKPEWLEDEKLSCLSDTARVLSVGLILLSDDHGNGRASTPYLRGRIWGYSTGYDESSRDIRESLAELSRAGFCRIYAVNGETYFTIRNWGRHQKVDKIGKPRVPGPGSEGAVYVSASYDESSRDIRESLDKSSDTLATDLGPRTLDLGPLSLSSEAAAGAAEPELPGEKKLSEGKRRTLRKHKPEALRLWALQNELRKKAIPASKELAPTAERVLRVAERLDAGATPDECEAVLRRFAEDVVRDPSTAKWFNGDTPWRPSNFERKLGMAGTDAPRGFQSAYEEVPR